MVAVRMRSTRRLRSWIIEQVSSGKYPGVMWDDEAKTMFRIPWKHAGKQDFRKDEDAAIFKAWAEFKGKPTHGGQDNPAGWKTRLRCALNKSPEFKEVPERAQLDISEPYKVYRLVPISEQGFVIPAKKSKEKSCRKLKRQGSEFQSNSSQVKQIKTEEDPPLPVNQARECSSFTPNFVQSSTVQQPDALGEIQLLDVRIEETVSAPAEGQDSLVVVIQFLGQEVVRRQIFGSDVRILYQSSSALPPTPAVLASNFPRILLPEPPATLPAGQQRQALFTLLPFMEKGVVLTSSPQGVYGMRFCQGRVFWIGPHGHEAGLRRMERNTEPVLLFSKDAFRQQLDHFRTNGGEAPQCSFTLCFGEELTPNEDPRTKLITAKVSLPWAEEQVQNALSVYRSLSVLQTLASQSPLGEITLNLVLVPPGANQELSELPPV